MIELRNVDLIGIDTNHPEMGIESLLISSRQVKFGSIKFFTCASPDDFNPELVKDIEFYKIGKFKDYIDYSTFCLSLGNYCDNDFILITHYDSFVINPEVWTHEFLRYDYIGAPFAKIHARSWGITNLVGNGGFSLRSKKMLDFSKQFKETKEFLNEDGFLIHTKYKEAIRYGIKYAPVDLAYRFSVHHLEDVGGVFEPEKYFGFHGCHNVDKAKKYLEDKTK